MKSPLFVVLWLNLNILTLLSFTVYGTNAFHNQQDADDLIVKLKPGSTTEDIDNILSKHPRFKLGRQFDLLGEHYFELVLDNNSIPGNTKPLSDGDEDVVAIKQDPKVETCIVDYKHRIDIRVSTADPELDYAWYLTNQPDVKVSMNIDKAWRKGYSGKGVNVAVVSTQIQLDHKDLVQNMDVARSIYLVNPVTNQQLENLNIELGTASAGIIGATRSNDFCSAGIAYNATLIAIGIVTYTNTVSTGTIIAALTHSLSTVDIYSNGWAIRTNSGFYPIDVLPFSVPIAHGATNGRQGKGSIYVFSAGSGGPQANTGMSVLNYNIYTIVVSSVEYDTVVSDGQVGSNIMTVAYGGTDRHKLIPYLYPADKCSSSTAIKGQSGSNIAVAPVTGIIALALEANPDLTWRDVQHLIVRSSRRYHFKDNFYPGYKWRRNGVGRAYHPKMGFGLIDALKMVTIAKRWKTAPEMINCTLDANVTGTAENRKYLTGNLRVSRRACPIRFLENVVVTVDVTYSTLRGFTEIELVSPKRTTSPLLTERNEDNDGNLSPGTFRWKFRTVHFWGENTIGNWKLKTRSLASFGQVGPVSWSVDFYGTAKRV